MGGEGGGGDRTIDQGCPSGTATRGKDQGLDLDLDLVRKDQSLAHVSVFEEPPKVVVTQPKGMLCRLDARFALALQPDAVFAIVIDPNNRRVFKNIKEVKLWNVLEDDGSCTVIESVQVTRFNFWFLSGAISTHLHIVQDRKKHQVTYQLAKPGMMKKFSGSWKIEPLFASDLRRDPRDPRDPGFASSSAQPTSPKSPLHQLAGDGGNTVRAQNPPPPPPNMNRGTNSLIVPQKEVVPLGPIGQPAASGDERRWNLLRLLTTECLPCKENSNNMNSAETRPASRKSPVVGSWVTIHQEVHPSFCPWPIRMHVRSMTAGIIREMLNDLQREALRLASITQQENRQQI